MVGTTSFWVLAAERGLQFGSQSRWWAITLHIMCGRYSFFDTEALYERFDVKDHIQIEPRYNVAPGQTMPVIVNTDKRYVIPMRWGLLPHWAKEEKTGYSMINARVESVAEKRSYKNLLAHNRCLVPANGFFEWQQLNKHKVPYFIHLKDDPLLAFAGLFSEWEDPITGKKMNTYTILTTEANEAIRPIHKRMPVILEREHEDEWLNPDIAESEQALRYARPVPPDQIEAYEVSTAVNKPTHDTQAILQPI